MPSQLILYSTSYCHLCEQAELILQSLSTEKELEWNCVEITDDYTLLSLYELKIPVLKRLDTNAEINWPFNIEDVRVFLGDSKV